MRTVEMHLPPSELSSEMAAMRVWLDERRFEPSGFNCRGQGEAMLLRLDFKEGREAEAFAERFGGQLSDGLTDAAAGIARRELAPERVVG